MFTILDKIDLSTVLSYRKDDIFLSYLFNSIIDSKVTDRWRNSTFSTL